jgi:hypothetical protein
MHSSLHRAAAVGVLLAALSAALAGCFGPTPGPPTTSQPEMSITSSSWRYDYPGTLSHSTRGEYYLNLAVSVTNRGTVPLPLLAAEFSLFWQNETAGDDAEAATISSTTLSTGQTGTTTVAFVASELRKPVRLEFRQAGFDNTVSATVPAPVAPPLELMVTSVSSNWSVNGTGNASALPGMTYLWVNATYMDHLSEALTIVAGSFHVVDANDTAYRGEAVIGPATLAPFTPVQVSALFEVPVGYVPKTLRVDIVLGPWTDAPVPPPA